MSEQQVHRTTDTELAAIASRQLGVITLDQAAAAGWSEARLRRRVRDGGSAPARHDLTVHRVRLPAHHVNIVDGVPITTYERTLIDMTGRLGLSALARSLDQGLVSGHVELHRLSAMIDELGPAPGRRVRRLRMLIAERGPEAERAESTTEIRMFTVIRRAGLPTPVPQYPVMANGERFRFDGAYPDRMIGLEYLGWDPHRSRTAFDRDHRRDRILSVEGWTIVYFTSASSDTEIVRSVERLLAR